MKMYKIDQIIELLQLGKESKDDYVGFETVSYTHLLHGNTSFNTVAWK